MFAAGGALVLTQENKNLSFWENKSDHVCTER